MGGPQADTDVGCKVFIGAEGGVEIGEDHRGSDGEVGGEGAAGMDVGRVAPLGRNVAAHAPAEVTSPRVAAGGLNDRYGGVGDGLIVVGGSRPCRRRGRPLQR
jgi:hypothetical protein